MSYRLLMRVAGELLITGALLLGHVGVAPARDFVPSGNPKRGRDVFVEKGCLSCHSVRGAGGQRAPDLAAVLVERGVFAIGAGMWSHAPQMRVAMEEKGKGFPELSEREVADLLAYLVFIGFLGEPGDAASGKILFATKGCGHCHFYGGGGDAPSVKDLSRGAPPIGIAGALWNHCSEAQSGEEWVMISEREMADIISFLSGQLPAEGLWAAPGNPVEGRVLFESKGCAACHLPARDGAAPSGRDLSRGGWYTSATGMAASMWNHKPAMTKAQREGGGGPLVKVRATEMADILSYLYLLRSTERVGDAERGEAVFVSKRCATCHEGEGPGKGLSGTATVRSPAHLASAMWNHAPAMEKAIGEAGLEWPVLSADDIADLLAYLVLTDESPTPLAH